MPVREHPRRRDRHRPRPADPRLGRPRAVRRRPTCTLAVDRERGQRVLRLDRPVRAGRHPGAGRSSGCCFLRTMEQALVDLLTPPARVPANCSSGCTCTTSPRSRPGRPPTSTRIVIMDDWGAQDRMMVSPAIWRELFKPIYREYCDVARQAGKFVFMHSDGCILDILPDLIEVGVQRAEQPGRVHGRRRRLGQLPRAASPSGARSIGRRCCRFGTLDDVRRAVRRGAGTPLRRRRRHRAVRVRTGRAARRTCSKCSAPGTALDEER